MTRDFFEGIPKSALSMDEEKLSVECTELKSLYNNNKNKEFMKRLNTILPIILFVIAGFGGCKQSGNPNDDFIRVDVTANYPKKELILQDFMDVEYIPLETDRLIADYEDGKLKEIAATLNEDSNPVIMLIKHKK